LNISNDLIKFFIPVFQIRMDTVNNLEWTDILWTITLDSLKTRRMRFLLELEVINGFEMESSFNGVRVGGCQKTQDRNIRFPQVMHLPFHY